MNFKRKISQTFTIYLNNIFHNINNYSLNSNKLKKNKPIKISKIVKNKK